MQESRKQISIRKNTNSEIKSNLHEITDQLKSMEKHICPLLNNQQLFANTQQMLLFLNQLKHSFAKLKTYQQQIQQIENQYHSRYVPASSKINQTNLYFQAQLDSIQQQYQKLHSEISGYSILVNQKKYVKQTQKDLCKHIDLKSSQLIARIKNETQKLKATSTENPQYDEELDYRFEEYNTIYAMILSHMKNMQIMRDCRQDRVLKQRVSKQLNHTSLHSLQEELSKKIEIQGRFERKQNLRMIHQKQQLQNSYVQGKSKILLQEFKNIEDIIDCQNKENAFHRCYSQIENLIYGMRGLLAQQNQQIFLQKQQQTYSSSPKLKQMREEPESQCWQEHKKLRRQWEKIKEELGSSCLYFGNR